MKPVFETTGTCLNIKLPEELDHPASELIRRESDRIMGKIYIRTICFDFGNTVFMDSSGVGLIMGRYRALGMRSGCMKACLMGNSNEMTIIFDSRPENEGLARVAAAAFCTQLNPTLEEVADLKTAVSEAVTNCIIHGYQGEVHKIRMKCVRKERTIYLDIEDDGIGIADVEKAMEPLYTTRADQDRSGMGFTFMEAFMDEVKVTSQVGKGTCVHMSKKIGN